MTDFAPKRAVLLTGAGFTNTVDAPLAKGMWDWIFQKEHIRKHPRLREALLDDLNFEDVYQKVIFGDYTVQEKIAFGAAVLSAYKDLDEHYKKRLTLGPCGPLRARWSDQQFQLVSLEERGFSLP